MDINASDIVSESFSLSTEYPSMNFHFKSIDFYFYLNNVHLILNTEKEKWQQLIAKIEIRLYLHYNTVDFTATKQIKEISYPVHLFINSIQVHPFFQLNKIVDKQLLDSNVHLDKIDDIKIKIALFENRKIDVPYSLVFEIKKSI